MFDTLARFALVPFVTMFWAAGVASAADHAPTQQTSAQGGVTVTVAPRSFANEAKTWDFDVTLETHTQPLGDDISKSSILLGDGKSYPPLGWEGAPPGGHHRKGVLRFEVITPPPGVVELQIRRSGEVSPRSFQWQLK